MTRKEGWQRLRKNIGPVKHWVRYACVFARHAPQVAPDAGCKKIWWEQVSQIRQTADIWKTPQPYHQNGQSQSWLGYPRIQGQLKYLGYKVCHKNNATFEKRRLGSSAKQNRQITWKEFNKSHFESLVAIDFFTSEIYTLKGLTRLYGSCSHWLLNEKNRNSWYCWTGVWHMDGPDAKIWLIR